MNNDLISREALKEALKSKVDLNQDDPFDRGYNIGIEAAIDLLDNAPTVEPEKVPVANVTFDADKLKDIVETEVIEKIKSGELVLKTEERPQGEWIKHEWGYSCSVCGVSNDYAYDNNIHKFTDYFCPNCGADMREEADNDNE